MKINKHFNDKTQTLSVSFVPEFFSQEELQRAKNDLIEAGASENLLNEDLDETIFENAHLDESDIIEVDSAGLWENIRKKKEREGKNYRPAKPGDKARPQKEAWKKAQNANVTSENYDGRKQEYLFKVRFENYEMASENKKKVNLNKPFRTPGQRKKFAVYVKNEKGNIVLVRFGDPNMEIKRDDPKRRKSFRARHHCESPGPKWKAQYWACQTWRADKSVKEVAGEEEINWFMLPTQNELFGEELPPFDIEEVDDCCWDCE